MQVIYLFTGFIVFWFVVTVLTALLLVYVILPTFGFVYYKIWRRTYLFQWHELKSLRRYCKKHSITDAGIRRMLYAMQRGRYKMHIFLPQIYELILQAQSELIKDETRKPYMQQGRQPIFGRMQHIPPTP